MSEKIDFSTFLLSLSSSVMFSLGYQDEGHQVLEAIDLEGARQHIDVLDLLAEKTKGNRTEEEDRLIEGLLFETRMRFLETKRRCES